MVPQTRSKSFKTVNWLFVGPENGFFVVHKAELTESEFLEKRLAENFLARIAESTKVELSPNDIFAWVVSLPIYCLCFPALDPYHYHSPKILLPSKRLAPCGLMKVRSSSTKKWTLCNSFAKRRRRWVKISTAIIFTSFLPAHQTKGRERRRPILYQSCHLTRDCMNVGSLLMEGLVSCSRLYRLQRPGWSKNTLTV